MSPCKVKFELRYRRPKHKFYFNFNIQVDAHKKPKAYVRLTTECEKLKKLMSANSTPIPLNIECFMDDKDVHGKMKRADMEEMAAGLIQRIDHTMKSCLDSCGKQ